MTDPAPWRNALAGLLCCMAMQAQAEHIIGGELYYDHLGGDQYRITLTLYRDCNSSGAQFDQLGNITIFTGDGAFHQMLYLNYPGSTFPTVSLDDPCLSFPPNICLETTSYVGLVFLPPNDAGYRVSYQRCCRQPSVQNLMNPGSTGLTCTTTIPPQPHHENSSPRFNAVPPAALCLGHSLVFDHSANDPDGDELVYSLATPLTGGSLADPYPGQSTPPPYNTVTWAPGYGATHQVDSEPPMAINPATGVLTAHPTALGNYVIAISVKEYREGTLLSETIRDHLFTVVACNAEVTAGIEPQSVSCTGELTVQFNNTSNGAQHWTWDFGDPTTNADTSTLQHPTWTYAEQGSYTVTLIANPGELCADTTQVIFNLYEAPEPWFTPPLPACGPLDTVLVARGQFGAEATFSWDLGPNADPTTATGQEITATFNPPGVHPVVLTVTEHGCSASFSANVITYPMPDVSFVADPPSPQHTGVDVVFTDQSAPNGADITSTTWWFDGSALQDGGTTWEWNEVEGGIHEVTLEMTTSDGCVSSFTMAYTVIPDSVIIPNVFSPNNDGRNDRLIIENAQFHDNTLTIYNRWGQVVFHAVNYRNQWTARDLSDGTYYYLFRLADGREYTGHLTLLR